MTTADEARPVREEDAFDVDAVAAWLREHATPAWRDRLAGTPEVRQFPGGASNLTYRLTWPGATLILRRPPAGVKARGAHDMGREHRIQAALAPVFPLVPEMVAHCDDESVTGSPFYVMTEVAGTIPRRELGVDLDEAATARLCESFWDVLVRLHSVDLDADGLRDRLGVGKGEGYVARQVSGWTTRLENARTDDLGDWSDVTAWFHAEQPADVGSCLVHNDFRLDNAVLDPGDPTRVAAVLDWELATVGDPLMDLGGALGYWVQADDDAFMRDFRRQPSHLPGMWTREQVVDHYTARTGRTVTAEQWRFYEAFGSFRLAVIAQQIWYRYAHGQTTNEAYAVFGPAVGHLERRCRDVIGGA